MDERNQKLAKEVLDTFCRALDQKKINYVKHDSTLSVLFPMQEKSFAGAVSFQVDKRHQLMELSAMLPFKVKAVRRLDMAVAVCALNRDLPTGLLDYDLRKNLVYYRMTELYADSRFEIGFFHKMLNYTARLADECCEKLEALNAGRITIEKFLNGT